MTVESSEPVTLGRKTAAATETDQSLVSLACEALRMLGEAGHAAEAGAIAGKMWTVIADGDPQDAARLNAVMHRVAKLDPATDPSPTATDEGTEGELDAQSLHPSVRHDTIFAAFAALPTGRRVRAAQLARPQAAPLPVRGALPGTVRVGLPRDRT